MIGPASRWRRATAAAIVALALLELLWELWLAPVRPGGSFLALKAVPLLLLWPGAARGKLRSVQWVLLLLPWYFAEGLVRAVNEAGRSALCAFAASLIALIALATGLAWIRTARRSTQHLP